MDTNVLKKWGHASDLQVQKYPEGFRGHYQEHQIANIRGKMESELLKMSIYSNDDRAFNQMMTVFDKITNIQKSEVMIER